MIGPNVVPRELTPPARFNRCVPVEGSPSAMAKGWAAVCCNEKPSATIKKEARIAGNEFEFAEGMINNAPTTEINKPKTIPRLYPILFNMSYPAILENKYNAREPIK